MNQDAAERLMNLDRVIHEPARLLILTVLANSAEVDFKFLENITGLNKGNLSSHASRLESAGYIRVKKKFRGKVPATSYLITPAGKEALRLYREEVAAVIQWP